MRYVIDTEKGTVEWLICEGDAILEHTESAPFDRYDLEYGVQYPNGDVRAQSFREDLTLGFVQENSTFVRRMVFYTQWEEPG